MNYEGEKYLLKLYRELYNKKSVKHSGTVSDNKYELINKYLKRLEKLEQTYNNGEKGIQQYIKNRFYDKYIIKEIDIPANKNKRLIIEGQKNSIDKWIDYLFKNQEYPMWAKYWAFQGMLKLGQYDKDNKKFTIRSKKTLSPFADIDIKSLNESLKMIIDYQNSKKQSDKELQNLLENGNFGSIYAYNINKQINNQNQSNTDEGLWKQYFYNEGKKIAKSLENKNTFWCITSETMANNYLEYGSLYIYYTKDAENNYTIPRICIRTEDYAVKEVKGVLDTSDNLEYSMIDIAIKKLKSFNNSDHFKQIAEDLKYITEIYERYQAKQELTVSELRFLYEIDRKISSFTWCKDSRIREILKTRNAKQDLAKIFNCSTDKIGTTLDDLKKDNLYVYYGSIFYEENEIYIIPPIVIGNINTQNSRTVQGFNKLSILSGSLHGENLQTTQGLNSLELVTDNLYLNNIKTAEGLEKLKQVGGTLNVDKISTFNGLNSLQETGNLSAKSAKYAEGAHNLKRINGNLVIYKIVDLSGFENLKLVQGDISCYASTSIDCLPDLVVKGKHYFTHIINIHDIKKKVLKR